MTVARLLPLSSILLVFACQAPPAQVDPRWCEAEGALDSACAGEHCVAAVVVDYVRLEPRGYRVYSLAGEQVDREGAAAKAAAFIAAERGARAPDLVDADRAGDFYNCFLAYNDTANQWLVVIHAATGTVLFAEPEVWGDADLRGQDLPLPRDFAGPKALGCSTSVAEPQKVEGVSTGSPHSGALSTPKEAWSVAARLNVTEAVGGARYRAMVISYAPATGEFDAQAADWYVWINRLSQ